MNNNFFLPYSFLTFSADPIYANLWFRFKTKQYKVYIENVRLWIERYQIYTYPDVMIVENQPIYYGQGTSTITNPSVIFKVASKSTKNYDQGDKFDYYRSLPELKEYILVEQSQ